MSDIVSINDAGRYTNVFVGDYMIASVDHEESEVSVYGVGNKPLETFGVNNDS